MTVVRHGDRIRLAMQLHEWVQGHRLAVLEVARIGVAADGTKVLAFGRPSPSEKTAPGRRGALPGPVSQGSPGPQARQRTPTILAGSLARRRDPLAELKRRAGGRR
jgi:hypothetical protein